LEIKVEQPCARSY